jgi:hypothetical protein
MARSNNPRFKTHKTLKKISADEGKAPPPQNRLTFVAVTDLTADPRNPRKHSREQIRAVARSIQAFGFNAPILIDKDRQRFKPGVSGNPKGRPKRKPSALAEIIRSVLSAPIQYREGGRIKATTRHELSLKMLIEQAVTGNLVAVELVLKVRAHAQRFGEAGVDRLHISDWLPDYPGQTADQKTQEFASTGDANPFEWWHPPDKQSGAAGS